MSLLILKSSRNIRDKLLIDIIIHVNYNFYKLIRYNFDLVTNFSLAPIQVFTVIGVIVSAISGFLVIYMIIRRLVVGAEVEGVFTLFAIAFLLIGFCLFGLGILGEYIGRIYKEVVAPTGCITFGVTTLILLLLL